MYFLQLFLTKMMYLMLEMFTFITSTCGIVIVQVDHMRFLQKMPSTPSFLFLELPFPKFPSSSIKNCIHL